MKNKFTPNEKGTLRALGFSDKHLQPRHWDRMRFENESIDIFLNKGYGIHSYMVEVHISSDCSATNSWKSFDTFEEAIAYIKQESEPEPPLPNPTYISIPAETYQLLQAKARKYDQIKEILK